MKSLIFALVIATASTLPLGIAAHAQNIGGATSMPNAPAGSRVNNPSYMDRKCTMKTVRRHVNGQVVLKKVKSCH